MAPIAIGVHGGCGTLDASLMSASEWAEARAHFAEALRAGWAILSQGGGGLDAVTAAVAEMEDSWHFNAGFGAALNAAGEHELDASIMDGATFGAGAVCGVRRVRNPIRAARAVMERSSSVLIAGSAADDFAATCGLEMVSNSYFTTDRRRASLAAIRAKEASGQMKTATEAEKHGTVGAVALDAQGNLAAGTSTGGFNNKPVGRVGDSPIIGAGTYARNGVCAVSGTGQGEVFIKRAAAYDVAARMMYTKADVAAATGAVVEMLGTHSVGAGLIACDSYGNVVAPFNTLGMYRGWVTRDGDITVATHRAEVHMGRVS